MIYLQPTHKENRMKLVYEGTTSSGIPFQIQEAEGFAGRSELAIVVKGTPVAVVAIDIKRGGAISIKPQANHGFVIPADKQAVGVLEEKPSVTLRDVIDSVNQAYVNPEQ